MNKIKEPLYRKINKRVRKCGAHLDFGGDHRHVRHSKSTKRLLEEGVTRSSMHGKEQRGRDYRPLYRFLLSNVGQDWTAVHSEAVARLDDPKQIFYMVARTEEEREDFFNGGENAYFNGLYVDSNNILQKVKPDLCAGDINKRWDGCTCCTYTLNGVPFITGATMKEAKSVVINEITPRQPTFD